MLRAQLHGRLLSTLASGESRSLSTVTICCQECPNKDNVRAFRDTTRIDKSVS